MKKKIKKILKNIHRCEICDVITSLTDHNTPTKISKINNLPFDCCEKCAKTNAEPYWMLVNLGAVFKYKTIDDIPQYTIDLIIPTLEIKGITLVKYFEDVQEARKTMK